VFPDILNEIFVNIHDNYLLLLHTLAGTEILNIRFPDFRYRGYITVSQQGKSIVFLTWQSSVSNIQSLMPGDRNYHPVSGEKIQKGRTALQAAGRFLLTE
jgi:hypothetical protein